ncbi:MAG: hypothetical protein HYV63_19180 [Candidatus Schekmanbacteria bacterium]|nr:hypothetical protein [Candidatus Schekmanbacteria bacterium]
MLEASSGQFYYHAFAYTLVGLAFWSILWRWRRWWIRQTERRLAGLAGPAGLTLVFLGMWLVCGVVAVGDKDATALAPAVFLAGFGLLAADARHRYAVASTDAKSPR